MSGFVRRITLVERGPEGVRAQTLYRAKRRKRRKLSAAAKPLERSQRRLLEAVEIYTADLRQRQDRSNRKRRDGWLRDATKNQMRASRKAIRKTY